MTHPRFKITLHQYIEKEERDYIINLCKSYSQIEQKKIAKYEYPDESKINPVYQSESYKPGDDYNYTADAFTECEAILRHNGWTKVKDVYWRRPGKTDGISASFGKIVTNGGVPLFHVFTSNAHPFDVDKTYTPFTLFTYLSYGTSINDFSRAAKELYDRGGYGHDDKSVQNENKKIVETRFQDYNPLFTPAVNPSGAISTGKFKPIDQYTAEYI